MMLEWQDIFFREGIQLCCNVLDSIGGAESYSVSVSCVGSPANVQGLDSVPAPQSQKNLSCLINSTSCPWWHFLMQFTHMAFRSVVLQVWHLKSKSLHYFSRTCYLFKIIALCLYITLWPLASKRRGPKKFCGSSPD